MLVAALHRESWQRICLVFEVGLSLIMARRKSPYTQQQSIWSKLLMSRSRRRYKLLSMQVKEAKVELIQAGSLQIEHG